MAVLILAMGIGGTTAVFSVADKVLLNPIPGRDTDRLISVRDVDTIHADQHWHSSPPVIAELALKFVVRGSPELLRVYPALELDFIHQFLQRGTRMRIVNNPFPRSIAVPLGKQTGQTCRQLLAFLRGERLDGFLDFFDRAHISSLQVGWAYDKFASPPFTHRNQTSWIAVA